MAEASAGAPARRRVRAFNGGFFLNRRLRRILALSGHDLRPGRPGPEDAVLVWGQSPTAWRGETMAARHDAPLIRVEDAFLRSLRPGRSGEPPLGLLIDREGLHFDPRGPSELETLLAREALDDTALLDRARGVIARLRAHHLTKYAAVDPALPVPEPGYVLIVDQTRGDASLTASGADAATFRDMLTEARLAHPGARIVVKTHPETAQGHRPGHLMAKDLPEGAQLFDAPASPWDLLEGAVAVYTVSSQLGFEAILAGHEPHVFGGPFYAGWGLSHDRFDLPRRGRKLTAAQLVAAALILYPTWYDPYRDRLCEIETVLATLEARARAWREDRHGWVGTGIRLWKRAVFQRVFGRETRMRFADPPEAAAALAQRLGRPVMGWAAALPPEALGIARVEDGFLRSRGLGAELVPPLSLVLHPEGIYYDPTRPSGLETLIHARRNLRPDQALRARALQRALTHGRLSKYNLGGAQPDLPDGHRVLVVGQVEDDASIRKGAGDVATNLGLLSAARAARPDAVILYKPHPDVEAGLRSGAVPDADQIAD